MRSTQKKEYEEERGGILGKKVYVERDLLVKTPPPYECEILNTREYTVENTNESFEKSKRRQME